jgi:hypothetical protein
LSAGGAVWFFYKSPVELNIEIAGKDADINQNDSKTEPRTLSMVEIWKIP